MLSKKPVSRLVLERVRCVAFVFGWRGPPGDSDSVKRRPPHVEAIICPGKLVGDLLPPRRGLP
jgi:hypothetical protein